MLVAVKVEHELPNRALHAGEPLLEHDKARTTEFGGGLEVHEAERATEIVMRFWRETVAAGLAEHMTLHVAVLVDAVRHLGQRQIRDRRQQAIQPALKLSRRLLQFSYSRLKLRNLDHQIFSTRIIFFLFCFADFL